MAAKIKDVAARAQVSMSTVSKVLKGTYSISDDTKDRVYRAIQELGYYPNSLAEKFSRNSSNQVAVFIDVDSRPPHNYNYDILTGIESVLRDEGYMTTVADQSFISSNFNYAEQLIRENRLRALIIHASCLNNPDIRAWLGKATFPYVVIGDPHSEETISWIDYDNTVAGEILANHIIDEGFSNVHFIGGDEYDILTSTRLSGIQRAYERRGLVFEDSHIHSCSDHLVRESYEIARRLMRNESPDAIITVDNSSALSVYHGVAHEGKRIPEDVAVAGFDNVPIAHALTPPLTVVDLDMSELGANTARVLLSHLRSPEMKMQYRMLAPKLLKRPSTIISQSVSTVGSTAG